MASYLQPARVGLWTVAAVGSWSPLTWEKLTPACSKSAPWHRIRVRPPPPLWCVQISSVNNVLPSVRSSAEQT